MLAAVYALLSLLCILKIIGNIEARKQRKATEDIKEHYTVLRDIMAMYTDLLNQEVGRIDQKIDEKLKHINSSKEE